MWPTILTTIGSLISGFFGFKKSQSETVQESIKVLSDVNSTDAQVSNAAATVLSTIMSQGSWLEKNWRPILMVIFAWIIISFWYGHVPPHVNDAMSPMMAEIFLILKIGISGYIPARTLEKIMTQFNIAGIVKQLIAKRIS